MGLVILGSIFVLYNPQVLGGVTPIFQQARSTAHQIKIGNIYLNIEIADTPELRSKGLGGRDSLPADSGMLFVFPKESKYQFWMRGMKFPLDFIFIRQGKVVDLLRNVQPPLDGQKDSTLPIYAPVVPVDMMLEVNTGFIDTNGIRVGDQVFLVEQAAGN